MEKQAAPRLPRGWRLSCPEAPRILPQPFEFRPDRRWHPPRSVYPDRRWRLHSWRQWPGLPVPAGGYRMKLNTRQAPVADAQNTPVVYEQIEDFARLSIQKLLQQVLEEEVENLLGRLRSERRDPDSPPGYRNGYGKDRRLSTSIGTVTVRRPRVRNTEEPFVSQVLPLFRRRTQEVGQLLPSRKLSGHGLCSGDFELAMRRLLGEGAPLSASSIARLRDGWTAEFITWKQRSLLEAAFLKAKADRHHLGRWHLLEGGVGEGESGAVGSDRRSRRRNQGSVGGGVWSA